MSDKATPAFIQQLIARMGKSGDAAGILTLFAHMAELEARLTTARAGKLDLVGTAFPAAGGQGTLFEYLKLLYSLLGTVADGAGQETMFAYFKRLEAFVDDLETRLTAARATKLDNALLDTMWTNTRAGKLDLLDTLCAYYNVTRAGYIDNIEARTSNMDARLTAARALKLDYLDGYISTIKPLPAGTKYFSQPTSAESPNTWLNIAGAGYLMYLWKAGSDSATVQLDGGSIYLFGAFPANLFFGARFNTSCVVKGSNAADSTRGAFIVLD